MVGVTDAKTEKTLNDSIDALQDRTAKLNNMVGTQIAVLKNL